GQLINMIISAPGNSIIPNMGIPKFQMREGLINLGINILISFLLIKYYGILGAAVGNVIATLISSAYIYYVSAEFFGQNKFKLFSEKYTKPFLATVTSIIITALIFYISDRFFFPFNGRISGIIYLIFLFPLFIIIYTIFIFVSDYLSKKDKILISKIIVKVLPKKVMREQSDKSVQHRTGADYSGGLISIFIVTFNRLGLVRQCISSMLPTLKDINYELIIIDNASTDETNEFLNKIRQENERIKVIRTEKNIGINAKSLGADMSKGDFIIGVDDDVIMFPEDWVQQMVFAYNSIPGMGYLSTDVVQDETTTGAKYPEEMYSEEFYADGKIKLLVGPTGGWCFMVSREVYNTIGKLLTFQNRIFYPEDGDYINRVINKGLKYGILSGLKVYHATGEHHNKNYKKVYNEKYEDFTKKHPFIYKLKTKLKQSFSFRRYITKVRELADKKIK
ncbi:MAG: glycosyltransferase, partial [Ignavibacteria bacterium]